MPDRPTAWIAALTLTLVASACQGSKTSPQLPSKDDAQTSTSGPSPLTPSTPTRDDGPWTLTTPSPSLDEELAGQLQQLIDACALSTLERGPICAPDAPLKEVETTLRSRGARALPTLVALISRDEPTARRFAAWLMEAHLDARAFKADGLDPSALHASFARLLEIFPQSDEELGLPLARVVVLLSLHMDRLHDLDSLLERHRLARVRQRGYEHLVTHARMEAFPILRRVAQEAPSPDHVRAVMRAPLQLDPWREDESALLCPWARAMLDAGSAVHVDQAALLLRRCDASAHAAILAKARALLSEDALSAELLSAMDYLCGPRGLPHSSAATCQEARALHEDVVAHEACAQHLRAQALRQLHHQWADEQTDRFVVRVAHLIGPGPLHKATLELLSARQDDEAKRALKRLADVAVQPAP